MDQLVFESLIQSTLGLHALPLDVEGVRLGAELGGVEAGIGAAVMERVAVEAEDGLAHLPVFRRIPDRKVRTDRFLAEFDNHDAVAVDLIEYSGFSPGPSVPLEDQRLLAIADPRSFPPRQLLLGRSRADTTRDGFNDPLGPTPDLRIAVRRCRLAQGVESRLADGVQLLARRLALCELLVP